MSGPPPKHPSVRNRRNDPNKGFRKLSQVVDESAPPWPLLPNPRMVAMLETGRDKIASLQLAIEETDDGRTRGRLQRELNKLELATATLELQIEQARDAEIELWNEQWRKPQSEIWREMHSERSVALYVRWTILAEQGDEKAGVRSETLGKELGMTPRALLSLRAEVEQTEKVEDEGQKRRSRQPAKAPAKKKPDDPRGFLSSVS